METDTACTECGDDGSAQWQVINSETDVDELSCTPHLGKVIEAMGLTEGSLVKIDKE